jgi:hypothetical protein
MIFPLLKEKKMDRGTKSTILTKGCGNALFFSFLISRRVKICFALRDYWALARIG